MKYGFECRVSPYEKNDLEVNKNENRYQWQAPRKAG